MEDQSGQHEVIRPESMSCELLMCRVVVVNLGQYHQAMPAGNPCDPTKELVDLGLDHEATCACLLDHVAGGVKPHDLDAVGGEQPKPLRDQGAADSRLDVDVD